jgi:hypothetical protein
MDNGKDRVYTNLVMVVNMKALGVMDDILVLVSVLGKMDVVIKGTCPENGFFCFGFRFSESIPNSSSHCSPHFFFCSCTVNG